jgi:LAO/AO transport system kinase
MEGLADKLLSGDRRALARAITLVESSRTEDRAEAEALLQALLPQAGKALRLGLSGPPGVGKSTFIEAFGLYLIGQGHRVAVLAVDPSSPTTGGSILGDKTRMTELARHPAAFIRPTPAGRTLGGVARRTREAIALLEAAGFDLVIVETVGIGQSETAVAELVDLFCLILPPAGGDELQGIKKGVVELADLALINKADGELLPAARRAQAEYQSAFRMLRPAAAGWVVPVLLVSALEQRGLAETWQAVQDYLSALGPEGRAGRRRRQAARWLWRELQAGLEETFRHHAAVAAALPEVEAAVAEGRLTPAAAAEKLLALFRQ